MNDRMRIGHIQQTRRGPAYARTVHTPRDEPAFHRHAAKGCFKGLGKKYVVMI